MKTLAQRSTTILILAASFGFGGALPAVAQADQASPWSIKAYGVVVDADESFGVDRANGDRIEAGGNAILGIGGAVEYRLSELIGLEAAVAYSKTPDIDVENSGSSTEIGEGPSFLPIQLAVNFHMLRTEKLDVYAGPRIAWVAFGNFDLDVNGDRVEYEVDDEFGWGATAGISYQLGDGPLSLNAELTYLDVEMNVTDVATDTVDSLNFDPIVGNFGIRYQF